MPETRGRPIVDHSPDGVARRARYAALRGAGLCVWSASCGQPAALGSPCCAKHRDAMADIQRRQVEKRLSNNLCQCGVEVIGRVRCWLCSERRKTYASRQSEYRKMKERRK